MAVNFQPEEYHTVTPFLMLPKLRELIEFMKTAFDATERERTTFPDGTIMHTEVKIGDSIIMLAEIGAGKSPFPACMYLYLEDVDTTYESAIKAGADSMGEPEDQFWGDPSRWCQR